MLLTMVVHLSRTLSRHGGRRSIRSIVRSIDQVDRFDRFDNFVDFLKFWPRRGPRDLSCVKVSALYDAWRPKKRRKTETKKFGFFVKFDSIDSIIRSIRSIIRSVGVVDRLVFGGTLLKELERTYEICRPVRACRGWSWALVRVGDFGGNPLHM